MSERLGGIITNMGWRDYKTDPDPINFSVEWITKDLNYAKEFADQLDTPFLDDVMEKYKTALDKNLNKKDWTIINKL